MRGHVGQPAFDEYDTVGVAFDLDRPLSPFQTELLLAPFPHGTRVVRAEFVRREWLPCPIRVCLLLSGGSEATVYVRRERYIGGVETEATLFPVLKRLGLPVPTVLAGPALDPASPNLGACTVLSALTGTDLGERGWAATADQMEAVCALGIDAVERLHQATEGVRGALGNEAPAHVTLAAELQGVAARGGAWLEDPFFAESLSALLPICAGVTTPLVFSNGDYNPGNFLAVGDRLTGIIDFARARFEDPLIGFAKYLIYNFEPWLRAGFIDRILHTWGFASADFALRLAVRALFTLQREMPDGLPAGRQTAAQYRDRLYGYVRAARAAWR